MVSRHTSNETGLRIYRDAVVVITGGASGIGRALGEDAAKRGAFVVLTDVQTELVEEVAAMIRSGGGRAESRRLDVTDLAAVSELVDDVVRTHGRLDFMFNNAGIAVLGEAQNHEPSDWNRIIDVNLKGVVHGIQAAYPVMIRQGYGHIVNTGSITGLIPVAGLLGYVATKHAVVGLSNSLRVEATEYGVRVSVLCPGAIETAISDGGKFGRSVQSVPADVQRKLWEKAKPMPPADFAQQALDAIARNKAIIVIPTWWKAFWAAYRISPRWAIRLACRQNRAKREFIERCAAEAKAETASSSSPALAR